MHPVTKLIVYSGIMLLVPLAAFSAVKRGTLDGALSVQVRPQVASKRKPPLFKCLTHRTCSSGVLTRLFDTSYLEDYRLILSGVVAVVVTNLVIPWRCKVVTALTVGFCPASYDMIGCSQLCVGYVILAFMEDPPKAAKLE